MDQKERINQAIQRKKTDRPPILGGWLSAPAHIQALAGVDEDTYYQDTLMWEVEAERRLGSDGLIHIYQPISREEYRIIDVHTVEERAQYDVDKVLTYIRELETLDEMRASFDAEKEYAIYRAEFQNRQVLCGEMLWCPADWDILPTGLWYQTFGYETALTVLGLYPQEYFQLIRWSAEKARLKAGLVARAIREGVHPGAILTGEDICSQRGPMVSPAYLRKWYWPWVEYSFEPLLEAGAKLIWHCDGDVRPILNEILASGVEGLQGFQRECGMELEWIVTLQTRQGDPLILYGPLEVTTTLPFGTPGDIRAEVKKAMDLCRDNASLLFFTSNTITPDVPLENIRAYWNAVQESHW